MLLGENDLLVGGPLEGVVLAELQKEAYACGEDVSFVGIVQHLTEEKKKLITKTALDK